jgi:hypothetical protein
MFLLPSMYWCIEAIVASDFMGFKLDWTFCSIAWIGDQAIASFLLTQENTVPEKLKS